MSTATLTSLAMLKVNIDQGKDYLDYLRPFVLQVLVDHPAEPVTDASVRDHLRAQFGLEIPDRAVQVVLRRFTKHGYIRRETGVYHITGTIPHPGIAAEKANAARHIQAIVADVVEFSKRTPKPFGSDEEAVTAVCAFLAEFDIPCLRAYLRGTAIPSTGGGHGADIVLVSEYVLHLQKTSPERFESFLVLVQGHMLANALLCPDLQSVPKTYKGVTFYLDTPLLVRRLGLEGTPKQAAIEALIDLLVRLGASVATFSHSRQELERVVRGAAAYVDAADGRGDIIMEARRNGRTKSDLLLFAERVDEELTAAKIEVRRTPQYLTQFQIDESAFEAVLQDEVAYYNSRAREDDINSVRSIYVLRKGTSPVNVERAGAVLVSSNAGFARAAFEYGQRHQETREVSSVITDFSLANMAWLKAPMGAPAIPAAEILAFSYAALQPSKELLTKFLSEIDKLERQGTISARDHQLLRSSTLAQDELVRLTLGDDEALTSETVTETLRRVTGEIKKEETSRLRAESEAHQSTQHALEAARLERSKIQERLFWRCVRRAKLGAWVLSVAIVLLLVAGLVAGIGLRARSGWWSWILIGGTGVLLVGTILNLVFGATVAGLHGWMRNRLQVWLVRREANAAGIELKGTA